MIIVTGGAGFIGSHLCERLLADGQLVTSIDNYSTGRRENVASLGMGRFMALKRNVRKPIYEIDADAVYNLACPASPAHYQWDPVGTLMTCVTGTLNVLEFARDVGAKVLQASTSEVYGDPRVTPQTEAYLGNVNPTGPRACYDEGKRCAESLCFDFHRKHNVRIAVARIFNTYGPRMRPDDGRVVSNFIVQALKGEDITIYGTGLQTRAFCYVTDMVDGLVRLMNATVTGPVNLGNPVEITVLELAEQILRLTASKSRIVFHPLPVDDPVRRCPDIGKARSELGWEPTVPLVDGLNATIEYFGKKLQGLSGVLNVD